MPRAERALEERERALKSLALHQLLGYDAAAGKTLLDSTHGQEPGREPWGPRVVVGLTPRNRPTIPRFARKIPGFARRIPGAEPKGVVSNRPISWPVRQFLSGHCRHPPSRTCHGDALAAFARDPGDPRPPSPERFRPKGDTPRLQPGGRVGAPSAAVARPAHASPEPRALARIVLALALIAATACRSNHTPAPDQSGDRKSVV